MAEQLLTVREAAAQLGKTEKALRFAIHADEHDPQPERRVPRSAKFGGRRLFRASDVEAFINAAFDRETA